MRWKLAGDSRFLHWDALFVAAATRLNCAILYSEELSEGRQHGTVRALHPFLRSSRKVDPDSIVD